VNRPTQCCGLPGPVIISRGEGGVNLNVRVFPAARRVGEVRLDPVAMAGHTRISVHGFGMGDPVATLARKALGGISRQQFRGRLLAWYDANARDLPWRERAGSGKRADTYRVWVSEIMLQQTRVAAVIEHYQEFLRRFPTVEKLAAARESSVLAAWSGLGYYRRARMLHAAAKVIAREMGGRFPATAKGWRELPGIGCYTSAAIASITCGEAVAVVDGNVERVLQRVSGKRLAAGAVWGVAEELLDRQRPGDFNQAMMELGAVVCTPRAPACLTCPVIEWCATRGEMADGVRPTPQKKREIHYVLHRSNGSVLLVKRRRDVSLMAGMWELPETPANGKGVKGGRRNGNLSAGSAGPLFTLRHSITVTDYTVHVWPGGEIDIAGEWIEKRRLSKLALTGLARKILGRAGLIKRRERAAQFD
jgi:A/G-specific adenine glycosylase